MNRTAVFRIVLVCIAGLSALTPLAGQDVWSHPDPSRPLAERIDAAHTVLDKARRIGRFSDRSENYAGAERPILPSAPSRALERVERRDGHDADRFPKHRVDEEGHQKHKVEEDVEDREAEAPRRAREEEGVRLEEDLAL